jgi:hypothetical protein
MQNKSKKISDLFINEDSVNEQTFFLKIKKYIYQKYNVWDVWDLVPYSWRMTYYDKIKPIFLPQNNRLRKAIPRVWADTTHLLVHINFEMIKIFYEEEYLSGLIDWESDDNHKEFSQWLEEAYRYITVVRPQLEINLADAYPTVGSLDEWFKKFEPVTRDGKKFYVYKNEDDTPYEIKYAEVIKLEKLIEDNDTKFITEAIQKRSFFWT